MDLVQRNKYKQLANDALIAYFGTDGMPQQLAEALERCVEELEYIGATCATCSVCSVHGDFEYEFEYEDDDNDPDQYDEDELP